MRLAILFLIATQSASAATVVSDSSEGVASDPLCGVVLESSPYNRGPQATRLVQIGIDDPSVAPEPVVIPVHITTNDTERAPSWGDVVALRTTSVGKGSWSKGAAKAITGHLATPLGRCQSNDGQLDPWAALDVGAKLSAEMWQ